MRTRRRRKTSERRVPSLSDHLETSEGAGATATSSARSSSRRLDSLSRSPIPYATVSRRPPTSAIPAETNRTLGASCPRSLSRCYPGALGVRAASIGVNMSRLDTRGRIFGGRRLALFSLSIAMSLSPLARFFFLFLSGPLRLFFPHRGFRPACVADFSTSRDTSVVKNRPCPLFPFDTSSRIVSPSRRAIRSRLARWVGRGRAFPGRLPAASGPPRPRAGSLGARARQVGRSAALLFRCGSFCAAKRGVDALRLRRDRDGPGVSGARPAWPDRVSARPGTMPAAFPLDVLGFLPRPPSLPEDCPVTIHDSGVFAYGARGAVCIVDVRWGRGRGDVGRRAGREQTGGGERGGVSRGHRGEPSRRWAGGRRRARLGTEREARKARTDALPRFLAPSRFGSRMLSFPHGCV